MRLDTDIKADIIAELEEVEDPRHSSNLLDALMVEGVIVRDGAAQVTLVFEDDRPQAQRDTIEAQIRAVTADIDGLVSLHFDNLSTTELRRMDPLAWVPGQASAPAATEVAAPAAGLLTLGTLMARAEEEAPAEDDGEGLNLYAGGGCAAGTKVAPTNIARTAAVPPSGEKAPARTAVLADGMVTLTAEEFANLVAENRVLRDRLRRLSGVLRALADDVEG